MTVSKILLIDDSEEIHAIVKRTLVDVAEVVSSLSFADGLKKFEQDEYSIVIIDLNLDDRNGMELLKEFKTTPSETRFFILTGKDSQSDELMGHTYGVDEYIKKPVNRELLKAIVVKNLKILNKTTSGELKVSPFHIWPEEFRATMTLDNGQVEELHLTSKEFKILVKFVSHPDRPFGREELFNQVWESDSDSTYRTIDMHVSSLRKKLGPHGGMIKTVHQVGYKFSPK